MLRNALLRCLEVAKEVAVKAVLLHAIDEEAKQLYESVGFVECPTNQLPLFMSMLDINKIHNP